VPDRPQHLAESHRPLSQEPAGFVDQHRDTIVVFIFEGLILCDVAGDNPTAQQRAHQADPGMGLVTEMTSSAGEEHNCSHYRFPSMRPATAAVILGLLLLILGSSLIWLIRNF
jgi:hypothetical protein